MKRTALIRITRMTHKLTEVRYIVAIQTPREFHIRLCTCVEDADKTYDSILRTPSIFGPILTQMSNLTGFAILREAQMEQTT
jgi:hypothetical protein